MTSDEAKSDSNEFDDPRNSKQSSGATSDVEVNSSGENEEIDGSCENEGQTRNHEEPPNDVSEVDLYSSGLCTDHDCQEDSSSDEAESEESRGSDLLEERTGVPVCDAQHQTSDAPVETTSSVINEQFDEDHEDPAFVRQRLKLDKRYELKKKLGKGRCGHVWLVFDKDSGIRLALKYLSEPAYSDTFRREVQALSSLKHNPYVVVLGHTELAHDPPYFFMDYVGSGDTLRDYAKRHFKEINGRQGLDEVLLMFDRICSAIEDGHKLDPPLLHRDLKPGNIGMRGNLPVVLDWGLSRIGGETLIGNNDLEFAVEDEQTLMSLDGRKFGTRGFSAPEQLLGTGEIKEHSDIYAIGSTLFFVLTGTSPGKHRGKKYNWWDGQAEGYIDENVINVIGPPSPMEVNSNIPKDLAELVVRCMQFDPKKRLDFKGKPLTVSTIRKYVGNISLSECIPGFRYSFSERTRRVFYRHPKAAKALVLAALLFVAAIIGLVIYQNWKTIRLEKGLTAKALVSTTNALNTPELPWCDALFLAHSESHFEGSGQSSFTSVRQWLVDAPLPLAGFKVQHDDLDWNDVRYFEFSRDETRLLVHHKSGNIQLWDWTREAPSLSFSRENIETVVLSASSDELFAADRQGNLHILDFHGKEKATIAVAGVPSSLAIDPTGHFLAIADGKLRVIDRSTLTDVHVDGEVPSAMWIQWSPAGKTLFVQNTSSAGSLWSVEANEASSSIKLVPIGAQFECLGNQHGVFVNGGAQYVCLETAYMLGVFECATGMRSSRSTVIWPSWNPPARSGLRVDSKGTHIAIVESNTIKLCGIAADGEIIPKGLVAHSQDIRDARFFGEDGTIITAASDNSASVSNINGGRIGQPLPHSTGVTACAVKNGNFSTLQSDGLVRVWTFNNEKILKQSFSLGRSPHHVIIDSTGRYALLAGSSHRSSQIQQPCVMDFESNNVTHFGPANGCITDAVFTPDERSVLVCVADVDRQRGTVFSWDFPSLKESFRFDLADSEPRGIAVHPIENFVAVVTANRKVILLDRQGRFLKALSEPGKIKDNNHFCTNGSIAFSPAGRYLAIWGFDGNALVWDLLKGNKKLNELDHSGQIVYGLSFSNDERYVATAGFDRKAKVWELSNLAGTSSNAKRMALTEIQHGDWVYRSYFSKDGSKILTTSRDGIARVLDWRKGREVASFSHQYNQEVFDAGWIKDEKVVVTVAEDGFVRIWDVGSSMLMCPPQRVDPSSNPALWHVSITTGSKKIIASGGANYGIRLDTSQLDNPKSLDSKLAIKLCELISLHRLTNGRLEKLTSSSWLSSFAEYANVKNTVDSRKNVLRE